jgi:hypothetical protein
MIAIPNSRDTRAAALAGGPRNDVVSVNVELGRAQIGAANDRDNSSHLFARDQTQGGTGWAGKHSPVGIFVITAFAGFVENENRSGTHLFGYPLGEIVDLDDHVSPPQSLERLPVYGRAAARAARAGRTG